jgi:O-antigen/teichoic acid export membrane protein
LNVQKTARNLVAGLLAAAVSTIVGLLVVPVYLRSLGDEGYGLAALFLALQALLQVFDVGLTATANREVARARASHAPHSADPLLAGLAWVTWCVAAGIGLIFALGAPLIAGHWLKLRALPVEDAVLALVLMAVALGLRWPAGLYQNVLLGRDELERWSRISIAMSVFAHVGAAAVLLVTGRGLIVFFAWQLLAAAVYVAWLRNTAQRVLPPTARRWPGLGVFRDVKQFSTRMVAIGATGVVLTHVDKLVLSRVLPLEVFGHYMLASMIAGGLYVLVTPVFNWCYPHFSMLANDEARLAKSYRLVSFSVAVVLFPLVVLLTVGGRALLVLWLGDAEVAGSVAPVLAMLAAASALHGIMFVPYALTLARGAAGIALRINIVLLLALVPLMTALAARYGVEGAALAWLVVHVAYVVFGGWFTHRSLVPDLALRWLAEDVVFPALLACALGFAGKLLLSGPLRGASPYTELMFAALLCGCGWLLPVAGSRRLRRKVVLQSLEST